MYRVISEGKTISLCDEPRYVRKNPTSGAWIQTDEASAEAVAVQGTIYSLPGKREVEGASFAIITPVDSGEVLFNQYVPREKYDAKIAELEDALCEMDAISE